MGNLESPNQYGAKGDMGTSPGPNQKQLASPKDVGAGGDMGTVPANNTSGAITSPAFETNTSEAKGHK